jgi:hypothetical protein
MIELRGTKGRNGQKAKVKRSEQRGTDEQMFEVNVCRHLMNFVQNTDRLRAQYVALD